MLKKAKVCIGSVPCHKTLDYRMYAFVNCLMKSADIGVAYQMVSWAFVIFNTRASVF